MRFLLLGLFIGILLVSVFQIARGLMKYHEKLTDMKNDLERNKRNGI